MKGKDIARQLGFLDENDRQPWPVVVLYVATPTFGGTVSSVTKLKRPWNSVGIRKLKQQVFETGQNDVKKSGFSWCKQLQLSKNTAANRMSSGSSRRHFTSVWPNHRRCLLPVRVLTTSTLESGYSTGYLYLAVLHFCSSFEDFQISL